MKDPCKSCLIDPLCHYLCKKRIIYTYHLIIKVYKWELKNKIWSFSDVLNRCTMETVNRDELGLKACQRKNSKKTISENDQELHELTRIYSIGYARKYNGPDNCY